MINRWSENKKIKTNIGIELSKQMIKAGSIGTITKESRDLIWETGEKTPIFSKYSEGNLDILNKLLDCGLMEYVKYVTDEKTVPKFESGILIETGEFELAYILDRKYNEDTNAWTYALFVFNDIEKIKNGKLETHYYVEEYISELDDIIVNTFSLGDDEYLLTLKEL